MNFFGGSTQPKRSSLIQRGVIQRSRCNSRGDAIATEYSPSEDSKLQGSIASIKLSMRGINNGTMLDAEYESNCSTWPPELL